MKTREIARRLEFAYCSDTLSVFGKVTAGNPPGLLLVFCFALSITYHESS